VVVMEVGQGTNTSLGNSRVPTAVCYTMVNIMVNNMDNAMDSPKVSIMVSNGWGTTYQEGDRQGVHCLLLSTRV